MQNRSFEENVMKEIDYSEGIYAPDTEKKPKRPINLNALILAGVFVLGIVLPARYKAFAPALILVPVIINVIQKIRTSSELSEDGSKDPSYSSTISGQVSSVEPYSYTPKDPKDPRKYKPIG